MVASTISNIKFSLVLAFLAVVSVNSQCSICGEGKQVGNPDGQVTLPGNPPVSCSRLQQLGKDGGLPSDLCAQLLLFLGACDCIDAGPPTEAPVLIATAAPVLPTGCSICGDGKKVTKPDATFEFPGQPTVTCGVLESAGEVGQIPLSQCPFLPPLIPMCECQPIGATVAPSAIIAPTDAPAVPNTDAPAPSTDAPIVSPTNAPVTPPTDVPIILPTMPPTNAPVTIPTDAPIVVTNAPTSDAPVLPPTNVPIIETNVPIGQLTDAPTISPPVASSTTKKSKKGKKIKTEKKIEKKGKDSKEKKNKLRLAS